MYSICLSEMSSFLETHSPLPFQPPHPPGPASNVVEMIMDNANLRPADTTEHESAEGRPRRSRSGCM